MIMKKNYSESENNFDFIRRYNLDGRKRSPAGIQTLFQT